MRFRCIPRTDRARRPGGLCEQERAAKVGFSLYMNTSAGLDVLGEEFGEDDLFGKKFRADHDLVFWERSGRRSAMVAVEDGRENWNERSGA